MARICKHGTVVGTVDWLTSSKRYMSDGVILRNIGFGWKLHGKVKAGVTPQEAFARAQERLAKQLADNSAIAAYRALLHSMAGVSKRWKLHQAVTLMPDDCDGVWSEACDGYGDNVHADVEEVARLCASWQLVEQRAKESPEA